MAFAQMCLLIGTVSHVSDVVAHRPLVYNTKLFFFRLVYSAGVNAPATMYRNIKHSAHLLGFKNLHLFSDD